MTEVGMPKLWLPESLEELTLSFEANESHWTNGLCLVTWFLAVFPGKE